MLVSKLYIAASTLELTKH